MFDGDLASFLDFIRRHGDAVSQEVLNSLVLELETEAEGMLVRTQGLQPWTSAVL